MAHNLVETFLRWIAIQVEAAAVGHIDHSLFVCCTKLDVKRVVLLLCICRSCCYVARETILTILRIDNEVTDESFFYSVMS